MRITFSLSVCISVVLLVAALPTFGHAQSITEQSRKDSISISANPAYPEPGEQVELAISSYLVSLSGAQIQWRINGQLAASGGGKTSINYVMPESGEAASISLQINPAGRSVITKEFTIRPATIDLIWEAPTYTPPFYKGKALYTGAGHITVTALPFIQKQGGGQYRLENLVYEWEYNGLTHGSDSGLGQNSFSVDVNQANNSVSVTISNRSGSTIGQASASIPSGNPRLVFYQRSPTGLELNNSLTSSENSIHRESSIVAYPYFFPTDTARSETLTYQWYTDDNSINPTVAKNEILPANEIEASGFDISAEVESTEFIFPAAQNTASITF